SIHLPQTFVSDRFVWSFCQYGVYTAASDYRRSRTLTSRQECQKLGVDLYDEHLWARIWSLHVQPKLRFFLWKIIHDILPTFHALQSRHLDVSSLFPVCNDAEESISHLFFSCSVAQQLSIRIGGAEFTSTAINLTIFLRRVLQADSAKAIQLTYFWWRLWKSRNFVVFESYQHSIETLQRQFLHRWTEGFNSTQLSDYNTLTGFCYHMHDLKLQLPALFPRLRCGRFWWKQQLGQIHKVIAMGQQVLWCKEQEVCSSQQ
ncbi:hypothetical protein LINGRAHAP2_LOCUS4459, partial [Linum grandiflorum]